MGEAIACAVKRIRQAMPGRLVCSESVHSRHSRVRYDPMEENGPDFHLHVDLTLPIACGKDGQSLGWLNLQRCNSLPGHPKRSARRKSKLYIQTPEGTCNFSPGSPDRRRPLFHVGQIYMRTTRPVPGSADAPTPYPVHP